MKFIEMTGKMLRAVVQEQEISKAELHAGGVDDHTIVRINQQGDIEIRKRDRWDVVGGLLGDFELRLKQVTHLDWA